MDVTAQPRQSLPLSHHEAFCLLCAGTKLPILAVHDLLDDAFRTGMTGTQVGGAVYVVTAVNNTYILTER